MKSICNFGYARTKKGGSRFPDVRGLAKYLQYRDNRNDHIPVAGGPDRWVDGGLGTCYQHILARLDELSAANPHAYCHVIMVSPDPEALAQVDGDPQARFVEAVRSTVQEWEEWRLEHDEQPQAGPIEYSFVVHRPERNYGEQMHAHLILAAATEDPVTGEATPLYNNTQHVEAFKEITYRQLDHAFGLDREQERPERERTAQIEVQFTAPERGIEFLPFHEPQQPEEGR
jgi:hypothetical protein